MCQDLGRGLGSRKTGLSPQVMVLLTVPRRCSWCGSYPSDLNTGLFHIIIVDNYDDIPDDLVYVRFVGSGLMMHHWPHMTTGKTGRHGKARHVTLILLYKG